MAVETYLLWIDVLVFIALAVAMKFIIRNREFERQEVETTLNSLLFGIFFLFLIFLLYTFVNLEAVYRTDLKTSVPNSETYAGYLMSVVDLGLLPLFAVCFFVSIFLAREYLKGYPSVIQNVEKKEKKKRY